MKLPYIDMHCDTLLQALIKNTDDIYSMDGTMVDIKRMHEAGQGAQFFAIFFPPQSEKPFDEDEMFDKLTNALDNTVAKHSDVVAKALSAADIEQNIKNGKTSAVLSIEDARFLNNDIDKVKMCYDRGVRCMSFTWNFETCLGYPNSSDKNAMAMGLKPFGKDVLRYMNELGILMDVSHLSDGGFYDVAEIAQKPFVATHSSCRALSPHQRNLTDEMLRILADHGGVSGVNFCPQFVHADMSESHVTAELLAAHAAHMVKVAGEDVVALGTDFDGIGGTFDVSQPTEMYKLFDALAKAGLTERQIEKFAYANALRVLKDQ